ncbi:hypothetical protein [Pseudonocardia xinjiangensis]|uniref:hypothetical protein n=1 Tax=Pseudonocardia xinjiangensis TaxID=75289 RepID=UPI0031D8D795
MTVGRIPPALLAAAALAVVPLVTLPLPWWTAPRQPVVLLGVGPALPGAAARWPGWELLGPLRTVLLAALVVAAVSVVLLRSRRGGRWAVAARVLLVAAGAGLVATGVWVLAGWGGSAAAGAVIAILSGVGVVVLGAVRTPRATVVRLLVADFLAVALVAAAVPLLPGGAGPAMGDRSAGPFVHVAGLDAPQFRSGTTGLAGSAGTRVVALDAGVGAASRDGLAVVDARGRADVLAVTPHDPPSTAGPSILGVSGGRVVRWSAADALTVTGLDAADPVAVTVHGVSAASPPGPDGVVWLRATGDPPGTARLLDLAERDGTQSAAGTFLPVFTILGPTDSTPIDGTTVLPVRDGGLRFVAQAAGVRLERLSSGPTARAEVTVLAGGLDLRGGITGSGPASFLPGPSPLAVDAGGGIWFVAGEAAAARLVRLDPGGDLRAVAAPLPGAVTALTVAPAGDIVLALAGADGPALWRLPRPDSALGDLPPPPSSCTPHPAPVARPVGLVPVARAGRDTLGVPLGVDGRWAAGTAGPGAEVAVVAADGTRTPVGTRRDGTPGRVWPDGAGGVWWLESAPGPDPAIALVHGTAAGEQRLPAQPDPAAGAGGATGLVPDLGGRPPLLATPAGAFRIDGGAATRVLDGRVGSGVVRADGRGWVLVDGRLFTLDGDRVLGTVIDAGGRAGDITPVAVQLARGVAPAALALPRATVALDRAGRAVVVADDVVLAVGDDGGVSVVAQDRRLVGLGLFAAEGGLMAYDAGDVLRVDLP